MRAIVLCLLPSLAAAQGAPVPDPLPGPQSVEADLDGDGAAERYALRPMGDTSVDLVVEDGRATTTYRDVAWTGTLAGTRPWLEVSPAGSLVVWSENTGVGRDRWQLALRVAHRDGALRVAGATYEWLDTLDPEAGGTCDINFLSGRGRVATAAGTREVAAPFPALRLADWEGPDWPDPLAPCFAP